MDSYITLAKESLTTQAKEIQNLSDRLGNEFSQAIELILNCRGRVVLCGMGKSGLVGKKIAATFASTGTTSFFMHPAEAFHGDLGMLTPEDLLLLISYSGETEEVIKLLPSLKHSGNKIISILGITQSTLAQNSDVVLDVSVEREVCPNNLAPTTSTITTMAIGDALAVVLITSRGFQASDFARFHPGGSLGKRLLTQVKDVMHTDNLPIVSESDSLSHVIVKMTEGRQGLVVITNQDNDIIGIFTDGDLRRTLLSGKTIHEVELVDAMTCSPLMVKQDIQLYDAEVIMMENKVKALLVVDEQQHLIGIVDIFDQ
ncbi:MAG: KpsF/GutQ family sugar-phosphate isomerase [Gammaproteobacteria bacterium]|nr:KpsF/GutQ family sugar-phosphate isomerase [Gammaproteobacteria bacterium]